MRTFALGVVAGVLLAILLTHPTDSRQPSAPRPAVVTPLAIGIGAMGTPAADRGADPVSEHPAASVNPLTPEAGGYGPVPAPSHSTWTRPARTEALTAVKPPSAHTPRSPQPAQGQRRGLASWVRASLGAGYLAARLPRGTRLRVCGPLACVTRTVNDYGPSAKAFPERIVDLSARDFTRVCGPLSMGVCRVTVQ